MLISGSPTTMMLRIFLRNAALLSSSRSLSGYRYRSLLVVHTVCGPLTSLMLVAVGYSECACEQGHRLLLYDICTPAAVTAP